MTFAEAGPTLPAPLNSIITALRDNPVGQPAVDPHMDGHWMKHAYELLVQFFHLTDARARRDSSLKNLSAYCAL